MARERAMRLVRGGAFGATRAEGTSALTFGVFPQLLNKLPLIAKCLADLISQLHYERVDDVIERQS